MIGKPSIQKIIDGCIKKQAKYQRLMVEKYADFLYAICLRYMGNKPEAKEQVQTTFLKILNNVNQFEQRKGKWESWISTIAINTCLSELRKKKMFVVPIEEQQIGDVNPTVIDQLSTAEILAVVQSLPDIYREIFNLVEIDGYRHAEIAEMLQIKEGSSRARLARAKELLRSKLAVLKKNESWVNLA